jgi:hypothetical protein
MQWKNAAISKANFTSGHKICQWKGVDADVNVGRHSQVGLGVSGEIVIFGKHVVVSGRRFPGLKIFMKKMQLRLILSSVIGVVEKRTFVMYIFCD